MAPLVAAVIFFQEYVIGCVLVKVVLKVVFANVRFAVAEARLLKIYPVGTSAATSARNVGFAADPVAGPAKTVLAACGKRVAAILPEFVTGVDGVADRIVPSPTNDTLVTVPPPAPTVG